MPRRNLDESERAELLRGIMRRYDVGRYAALYAGFTPGDANWEPDWTKPQTWRDRESASSGGWEE